jgi:hypothetical protein
MDHDEAFKELTKRSGVLLRGREFKGSGQNFRRDLGEVWQVVNFQKSRWRDRSTPVSFTINVGTHFPRVPAQRWKEVAELGKLPESLTDFRLRVGHLLPERRDTWWEVDGDSFEVLWTRFEPVLTAAVLPGLDAIATREGLAEHCRLAPWDLGPAGCAARLWLGPLAPPPWDPQDKEKWKQDGQGRWWGPGEW